MTVPYDMAIPATNERGRFSDLAVHLRAADLSVLGMRTLPTFERTSFGWGGDSTGRAMRFGRKQPAYQWFDLDNDGVFETPAVCFFGARTNLVPYGADLSQWTLQNSLTRAEVASLGALRLWRLTDANTSQGGAQSPNVPTANRFAAGGNGVLRTYVAKGTTSPASGSSATLRDVTNSADRGRIDIGWAGTTPSASPVGGATVFGQRIHGRNDEGALVWEISWKGSGTLTGADHAVIYRAAQSATEQGDVIFGGAFLEDAATYPMPYVPAIANAIATVNRDEWRLPFAGFAGPCSFYLDLIENGTVRENGARVVTMGNQAGGTPEVRLDVASGVYRLTMHNGTSSVSSALTSITMPNPNDRFQLYGVVNLDGSVQLGIKIANGGWQYGALSGALAFPLATGWSGYPTDSWVHFGHPYANRQSTLLIEGKVSLASLSLTQLSGAFG